VVEAEAAKRQAEEGARAKQAEAQRISRRIRELEADQRKMQQSAGAGTATFCMHRCHLQTADL
jgi:hypothetical protein